MTQIRLRSEIKREGEKQGRIKKRRKKGNTKIHLLLVFSLILNHAHDGVADEAENSLARLTNRASSIELFFERMIDQVLAHLYINYVINPIN